MRILLSMERIDSPAARAPSRVTLSGRGRRPEGLKRALHERERSLEGEPRLQP